MRQLDSNAAAILRRRHWIFDLDGTLTRPQHDFAAIRAELEVPDGCGILETIAALPEPLRSQRDRRLTELELQIAEQAEPNPGAVSLLGQLHNQGVRLGIFSRNRRQCVAISLRRLGVAHWFDSRAVVGCEGERPKPDPEGIWQLIRHWGGVPADCLLVGDYRYDLEAGRAAGIATVLLSSDRGESWPDLTDLAVASLDQLATLRRAALG